MYPEERKGRHSEADAAQADLETTKQIRAGIGNLQWLRRTVITQIGYLEYPEEEELLC